MNGRTHRIIGTITGAAGAAYTSRTETPQNRALEIAGGAVGGYLGGQLLDVLEPATTPRHRGIAHSISANAAMVRVAQTYIPPAIDAIRGWADSLEQRAAGAENPILAMLYELLAAICRVGAGAIAGFTAGHFSHAVLDLSTPAGLPLLVAGSPSLRFA